MLPATFFLNFFLFRFRPGREWWELVIAFRKVMIVSIATFGTVMGSTDLQAFVALATVFIALVLHLIGKPFDVDQPNTRLLHYLECAALTICWFTFWGGLLFFLGHEKIGSISEGVIITMTIMIVVANSIFLIVATYIFSREYLNDQKKAKIRKESGVIGIKKAKSQIIVNGSKNSTQVLPINGSEKDRREAAAEQAWE